jgi:hypothetical protein
MNGSAWFPLANLYDLGVTYSPMNNYILVPLNHPIAQQFLASGTTSGVRGRTTSTRKVGARGGSVTQPLAAATTVTRRRRRRRQAQPQNIQG